MAVDIFPSVKTLIHWIDDRWSFRILCSSPPGTEELIKAAKEACHYVGLNVAVIDLANGYGNKIRQKPLLAELVKSWEGEASWKIDHLDNLTTDGLWMRARENHSYKAIVAKGVRLPWQYKWFVNFLEAGIFMILVNPIIQGSTTAAGSLESRLRERVIPCP